ncbi:MAG TPA: FxDxF family PEP-CTERM protein [Duganella sp.]|jgi:hypothetical protein|uniref:FxDxF family PEP-CTERM protein n=1 Tax=Duganella sp. TaxID=1904440 RepID=UPI002ED3361C
MKFFKQLIVAATLALCGAAAHADIYIPKDIGPPGVFSNTWTFSGSNDTAHVAGTDFADIFLFNVPDAQNITVSLTSFLQVGSPGVSFAGPDSGFIIFDYADKIPLYGIAGTNVGSLTGAPLLLNSGTYGLYVAGTYLLNGGAYGGQIFGAPLAAVPESSTVLMLLAGMVLIAGVARRRA